MLLQHLDVARGGRVKEVVICMTELVAARILIHGMLNFLATVYSLLDPSGKSTSFSVDH